MRDFTQSEHGDTGLSKINQNCYYLTLEKSELVDSIPCVNHISILRSFCGSGLIDALISWTTVSTSKVIYCNFNHKMQLLAEM